MPFLKMKVASLRMVTVLLVRCYQSSMSRNKTKGQCCCCAATRGACLMTTPDVRTSLHSLHSFRYDKQPELISANLDALCQPIWPRGLTVLVAVTRVIS